MFVFFHVSSLPLHLGVFFDRPTFGGHRLHLPKSTTTETLTDFCHATWDQLLCWPPTRPGHAVHLPCPPLKGIDPTRTCTDFLSLYFLSLALSLVVQS